MKAFSTTRNRKVTIVTVMILAVVIVTAVWLTYSLVVSQNTNSPRHENYGTSVTVNGKIVCLPHKNNSVENTLECAIGLHGDSGDFYGLKGLEQERLINGEVSVGKSAKATGTLLAPAPNEKYRIIGTLDIAQLKML